MNISHTCCVSLVGFDWGPSPSLAMYECWIKHSSNAVTKTLSSPVSRTERRKQGPHTQTKGAQPGG